MFGDHNNIAIISCEKWTWLLQTPMESKKIQDRKRSKTFAIMGWCNENLIAVSRNVVFAKVAGNRRKFLSFWHKTITTIMKTTSSARAECKHHLAKRKSARPRDGKKTVTVILVREQIKPFTSIKMMISELSRRWPCDFHNTREKNNDVVPIIVSRGWTYAYVHTRDSRIIILWCIIIIIIIIYYRVCSAGHVFGSREPLVAAISSIRKKRVDRGDLSFREIPRTVTAYRVLRLGRVMRSTWPRSVRART